MDLQKLMQQAQKMQEDLQNIQKELEDKIYEGIAQGVVAKVSGSGEVKEISIPDDLMTVEDKEILQDILVIAINEANDQASAERDEKLGAATGGINIPGL